MKTPDSSLMLELLEQYERDAALSKDADFGEEEGEAEDPEEVEAEEAEEDEERGESGEDDDTSKLPNPEKITKRRPLPPSSKPKTRERESEKGGGGKQKGKGKGKGKERSGRSGNTGGGGGGSEGWGGEEYEPFALKHIEKTLWRFQKRLNISPTQVVRFPTYGDTPLLYTTEPRFCLPGADKIPKCEHCGAARKFECQLMPNALSLLQPVAPSIPPSSTTPKKKETVVMGTSKGGETMVVEASEGMEWATVLIYTCSKSCNPDAGGGDLSSPKIQKENHATSAIAGSVRYTEEYVFVQPLL